MAEVAVDAVAGHIDLLLSVLTEAWEGLPDVARTIDDWPQLDQTTFVVEWPVQEERLRVLARYAADGALTPVQRTRYEQLRELETRHRPLLGEILGEKRPA
jgi:hypothetical protein